MARKRRNLRSTQGVHCVVEAPLVFPVRLAVAPNYAADVNSYAMDEEADLCRVVASLLGNGSAFSNAWLAAEQLLLDPRTTVSVRAARGERSAASGGRARRKLPRPAAAFAPPPPSPLSPLTRRAQAAGRLRPWLLKLVGRLAEGGSAQPPPLSHPAAALGGDGLAALALSRLLRLAPHVAPLAARRLAALPAPPLSLLLLACNADPPASPLPAAAQRALAFASLRLADAAAAGGDETLAAAAGAPATAAAALRCLALPDARVRWAASRIVAAGLPLSPAQAEALRRRWLSLDEVRRDAPSLFSPPHALFCVFRSSTRRWRGTRRRLSWRWSARRGTQTRRVLVFSPSRAAPPRGSLSNNVPTRPLWPVAERRPHQRGPEDVGGWAALAPAPALMWPRHPPFSRILILFQAQPTGDADTEMGDAPAVSRVASFEGAPGHVRAYGVDLPVRPGPQPSTPRAQLVLTPTARRNLEAIAMAACSVRVPSVPTPIFGEPEDSKTL